MNRKQWIFSGLFLLFWFSVIACGAFWAGKAWGSQEIIVRPEKTITELCLLFTKNKREGIRPYACTITNISDPKKYHNTILLPDSAGELEVLHEKCHAFEVGETPMEHGDLEFNWDFVRWWESPLQCTKITQESSKPECSVFKLGSFICNVPNSKPFRTKIYP